MNYTDLFASNQTTAMPIVMEEIGGIHYISKDLGLYIPYVTLFGLGVITGIIGKLRVLLSLKTV